MATNKIVSSDYTITANNGVGNITLIGNVQATSVSFGNLSANLITANTANVNLINTPTINAVTVNSTYVNSSNIGNLNSSSQIYGTILTGDQPYIVSVGQLTSLETLGNLVLVGGELITDTANVIEIYVGTDAYIAGNLWVNGNVNSVNSNVLVVEDPMIQLASNNVTNIVDIGVYGQFAKPAEAVQYTGLVRDPTTAEWRLFSNVYVQPTGTVPFGNSNVVYDAFHAGSIRLDSGLVANGNVTAGENVYANNVYVGNNITAGGIIRVDTLISNTSANLANLQISNSTIYLDQIQIKELSASKIGFFQADGITPLTIDASTANISNIVQGNSLIGISQPNGDTFMTVHGVANVAVWNQYGQNLSGNLLVDGNTVTGNLSVVGVVNSSLVPAANATYDLGSPSNQWKNVHVGGNTIYFSNVPLGMASNLQLLWDSVPVVVTNGNQNISTGGNIAATNLTANANVTSGNLTTSGSITSGGNVNYANGTPAITTTGNFTGNSATFAGNVSGANLVSSANIVFGSNVNYANGTSAITSAGNFTGNSITLAGNVVASGIITNTIAYANGEPIIGPGGNITSGNIVSNTVTTNTLATTGNASVGGNLSVVGNVSGNNISSNTITSITGSFSGNLTAGNISTTGTASVGSLSVTTDATVGGNVSVTGNVSGNNISGNTVTTTGAIVGGSISTAGNISGNNISGNTSTISGNSSVGGSLTVTGNISGDNITSNTVTTTGNSSVGGSLAVTGNISGNNISANSVTSTGNVTGGNLVTVGSVVATSGNISGNLTAGNISTAGNVSAGNLTTTGAVSASTGSFSGNVTMGNISANISSVTTLKIGNFSIFQSGTTLVFAYDSANIATLSNVGNIIFANNVTGFGTV